MGFQKSTKLRPRCFRRLVLSAASQPSFVGISIAYLPNRSEHRVAERGDAEVSG
jgi:hypothetical protein